MRVSSEALAKEDWSFGGLRRTAGATGSCPWGSTETDEPDRLLQVLEKAYGIHGIVRKTRKLFLIGRTRVHIDNVENLGDFLEFEVVLSENENTNEGKTEAHRLMDQFGIENDDLIECAYVDLINDKNFLQRSRFAPR